MRTPILSKANFHAQDVSYLGNLEMHSNLQPHLIGGTFDCISEWAEASIS